MAFEVNGQWIAECVTGSPSWVVGLRFLHLDRVQQPFGEVGGFHFLRLEPTGKCRVADFFVDAEVSTDHAAEVAEAALGSEKDIAFHKVVEADEDILIEMKIDPQVRVGLEIAGITFREQPDVHMVPAEDLNDSPKP